MRRMMGMMLDDLQSREPGGVALGGGLGGPGRGGGGRGGGRCGRGLEVGRGEAAGSDGRARYTVGGPVAQGLRRRGAAGRRGRRLDVVRGEEPCERVAA